MGNTIYEFFVDQGGTLRAKTTKNSIEQNALFIKGIPHNFQTGLNDPTKLKKVKHMLSHCFFSTTCSDIHVHVKGYGGWDNVIHRVWTSNWCKSILGLSCEDAEIISTACNAVDEGDTAPTSISSEARSWHFNTNGGTWGGTTCGSRHDTRIIHAAKCLEKAINLRAQYGTSHSEALKTIGRGLHAIQDTFAHTDAFVWKIPGTNIGFHLSENADDQYHIDHDNSPLSNDPDDATQTHGYYKKPFSQRVTATKKVTVWYLQYIPKQCPLAYKFDK